jgi:tRNA dimethylallyltransferase
VTPSDQQKRPVIAVVGPTASGKSALGIEMALRLDGEIVNCDSVQVYREIEIATAKTPLDERRGVPHHLIDFVSPQVNYTAGEWARAAARKIEDIEARGRTALVVGGTGFYLRALRRPFFPSPPTDETLRRRLTELRERRGALHLHNLLRRVDPQAASRLHERDWPRVQRALEVRFQTGRPISMQLEGRAGAHESAARLRVIALAGLVDEVRGLLERGFPPDSNALGAHGYRRVVEYLRGERSLAEAVEQTKLDVRHYAKRQLTWFRREPGVQWFDGFGDDPRLQQLVLKAVT